MPNPPSLEFQVPEDPWLALRHAFEHVWGLEESERDAFLRDLARTRPELVREVQQLLVNSKNAPEFVPPHHPSPSHRPGVLIDPYLLVRALGSGGQGTVYEAVHDVTDRHVAIKLLDVYGIAPKQAGIAAKRFRHEIDVLARLDHPAIARVYDSGTFCETPWFAMELVEGALPVTEALRRRERTEERDVVEAFLTFLDAAAYAHEHGVIHRDLKPSNLLLDERGRAKIVDFGIARLESVEERRTRLTRDGAIVGTIRYLAPEQLEGKRADARSDQYQLGLILCELLLGRLPYTVADQDFESLSRSIREARLDLGDASATPLGAPLQLVLRTALARVPTDRYPGLEEFAEDLRRILAGRNPLGRHRAPVLAPYDFARRHPLTAALLTAFLLASVITGSVMAIQAGRASEDLQAADRAFEEACVLEERATRELELERRTFETILHLALTQRIAELRQRALLDLWPLEEESATALEAWLGEAREVRAEANRMQATLADLEARDAVLASFAPEERTWYDDGIAKLEESLEDFFDPPPPQEATLGIHGNDFASVERRLALWNDVRHRSLTSAAARLAWEKAALEIRADARFRGLELTPCFGLLPLGRDPRSGLQEFLHVPSGDAPVRDSEGHIVPTPSMGLVLILIPGGTYRMGGEGKALRSAPVPASVSPAHYVVLDPFLISKFEMTAAQWTRIIGQYDAAHEEHALEPEKALLPITGWGQMDARALLHRFRLRLPTEARWEAATRARTSSAWYCGDTPESIVGHGNLGGRELPEAMGKADPSLEDDFPSLAPVGSFAPNPFGLHDVIGNALEWCEDGWREYEIFPPAPGDGHRGRAMIRGGGVARGGSWKKPHFAGTSFHRSSQPLGGALDVGIRPTIDLWTDGSR